MSQFVGIVIVSHSPDVARGAAAMVRQMVGDEVPCAFTGGNPAGELGTDPLKIREAIESVWSEAGVAVFVDLGGAEMNAEMAGRVSARKRALQKRIDHVYPRRLDRLRRLGSGLLQILQDRLAAPENLLGRGHALGSIGGTQIGN